MADASIEKELSRHDFFAGLAPEFIECLAQCASTRHMEPKTIVFRHGDHAAQFYLLRSGHITVEVPAIAGPSLEVQHLAAHEILGWSWLIAPYEWNFQAKTEEATEVVEFDGKRLLERCENDPAFGYALLKRFSGLMSERMTAARRQLMDEWNPAGFA